MLKLKILAWVHLITGALTLLLGLFILAMLLTDPGTDDAIGGAVIGAVLGLKALSSIVLGWALLALKPWSRLLGMILSVLHLPLFPVGTGIGIFGLLVLDEPETRALLSGDRFPRTEQIAW